MKCYVCRSTDGLYSGDGQWTCHGCGNEWPVLERQQFQYDDLDSNPGAHVNGYGASPDDYKPVMAGGNLTSSAVYGSFDEQSGTWTQHLPVIDLDFECRLVASRTEGHFHLYLDRAVSWDAYVKVLDALADAGLVEPGYVAASINDGWTAVRTEGTFTPGAGRQKDTP